MLDPNRAALVTLFQGMVAFRAALALSYLIGTLREERPVDVSITQLSALIGASQLLGLPLLILLHVTRHYALVPYALAAVCAIHFGVYARLYQTYLYVAMSTVIATGGMVLMLMKRESTNESWLASRG